MSALEFSPGIDMLLFLTNSVGQRRQHEEVEDAIPAMDRSCCSHIAGDVDPRRDGVCHLSLLLHSVHVSMTCLSILEHFHRQALLCLEHEYTDKSALVPTLQELSNL